jgi:hypothetical protein
MPKFTLTCEHDGPVGSKNTLEFEADFLPTVLEHFRQFLKGCTFEFDGELEISDVDYRRHREPEPGYDDECEEDYSVAGSQAFNTMAGNLIQPKQDVTTEDFWGETPSIGAFNTSSSKCPVCGLPESIMKRSVCFDKNCGLKK